MYQKGSNGVQLYADVGNLARTQSNLGDVGSIHRRQG